MSRLAVFGDSIAAGMGVRGATYAELVAESLGFELTDFSGVSKPVSHSLKQYSSDPGPFEFAIIAHGITEAIPRPAQRLIAKMPGRWRREGWMDPRPYFSSSLGKRSGQRIESAIRWRMRNLLLRVAPPRFVMDRDRYVEATRRLVEELSDHGVAVVMLGPPDIDQKRFPGSQARTSDYWGAVRSFGVLAVDLAGQLERWGSYCDDRFHPNDAGHAQIAELIVTAVRQGRSSADVAGTPA
jgi:hypothetical protein